MGCGVLLNNYFTNCHDEIVVSPEFYETAEGMTCRPKFFW